MCVTLRRYYNTCILTSVRDVMWIRRKKRVSKRVSPRVMPESDPIRDSWRDSLSQKVSPRVSQSLAKSLAEALSEILGETLRETFRPKESRQESCQESRIGSYAWLSARLVFFTRDLKCCFTELADFFDVEISLAGPSCKNVLKMRYSLFEKSVKLINIFKKRYGSFANN